jgi:dATP pyrophosphohydrolase
MPAFKRPESVLVVVHTVDGLVLMLERVSPPRFWQSVTGSLEADESFEAAAHRELAEETGLTDSAGLVDLDLPQRFRIAPPWRERFAPGVTHNLERAFALAVPAAFEPVLDPAEHRRHRWLPAREAVARASSWTNRNAIERIFPARGQEPGP